jgi:hypothetical protein
MATMVNMATMANTATMDNMGKFRIRDHDKKVIFFHHPHFRCLNELTEATMAMDHMVTTTNTETMDNMEDKCILESTTTCHVQFLA